LEEKKSDKVEYKLTQEEMIHQFISLFMAGMDTTAHAVGNILYFLCKYPKSCDEIR